MKVRPLSKKLDQKIRHLGLVRAYKKAVEQFEDNPRHPSLHYEIMKETRKLSPILRSFRINQKYRVEGYELANQFQVVNITNHYK